MGILLPYDVWCRIAEFIPADTLGRLYGLNRFFFEMAMHDLYKEVTLPDMDQRCIRTMG